MTSQKKLSPKRKRRSKIRFFVIEMLVLIIVLVVLYGYVQLSKVNRADAGAIDINNLDPTTLEALDGYTNIALFGLDNRTAGDYQNGRTDVIMVVSVNNDTNEIKLLSVYRDTYLLSDGSYVKANASYAYGGANQAINMLNQNLDLDITDYVTVDFAAVIDVVDAVGGVEVKVTGNEAKLMRKPTRDLCVLEDKNPEDEYISAGKQTLDGIQAVAYMRIRKDTGGDFKRTERQRKIIKKVVKKVKTSNIITLNSLLNQILPQISTSLTTGQLTTLMLQAFSYEVTDTSGFPFEKTTMDLSVGNAVIAADLKDNVIKLHEFLYDNTDYIPSDTVTNISYEITNATGIRTGDGY